MIFGVENLCDTFSIQCVLLICLTVLFASFVGAQENKFK